MLLMYSEEVDRGNFRVLIKFINLLDVFSLEDCQPLVVGELSVNREMDVLLAVFGQHVESCELGSYVEVVTLFKMVDVVDLSFGFFILKSYSRINIAEVGGFLSAAIYNDVKLIDQPDCRIY
jgi:hypothetical protein